MYTTITRYIKALCFINCELYCKKPSTPRSGIQLRWADGNDASAAHGSPAEGLLAAVQMQKRRPADDILQQPEQE